MSNIKITSIKSDGGLKFTLAGTGALPNSQVSVELADSAHRYGYLTATPTGSFQGTLSSDRAGRQNITVRDPADGSYSQYAPVDILK